MVFRNLVEREGNKPVFRVGDVKYANGAEDTYCDEGSEIFCLFSYLPDEHK